jgi:hypothetical protein
VVPLTGTNIWLEALNDEPLHQCLVVLSSIATSVLAMVVEAPDEAVPVIIPVQSTP